MEVGTANCTVNDSKHTLTLSFYLLLEMLEKERYLVVY